MNILVIMTSVFIKYQISNNNYLDEHLYIKPKLYSK